MAQAADVGDALVRHTGHPVAAIVMGLALAFEHPDWARALYLAAGTETERNEFIPMLKQFVKENPIDGVSGLWIPT